MYKFLLTTYDGENYATVGGNFTPVYGDTEYMAYCKVFQIVTGADPRLQIPETITIYWRLWKDELL